MKKFIFVFLLVGYFTGIALAQQAAVDFEKINQLKNDMNNHLQAANFDNQQLQSLLKDPDAQAEFIKDPSLNALVDNIENIQINPVQVNGTTSDLISN